MILMSETPIFDEWLALFDQDREQADRLAQSLRSQLQQFPILTGPHVQIGLEEYERAQQWLAEAETEPAKQAQLAQRIAIGRATMVPPPDASNWRTLWNTDPAFARRLQLAFRLKSAALGLATPRAITESLAAYDTTIGR